MRSAVIGEQLVFDIFAAPDQPAPRPLDKHQRGYVRLPWATASGQNAGDIVPAWVCCLCGGVELGEFTLELNHGCCKSYRPACSLLKALSRPFDAHWTADPRLSAGVTAGV